MNLVHPSDILPTACHPAWYRMQRKLIAQGNWERSDKLYLELAVRAVTGYAQKVAAGTPHGEMEELRVYARHCMAIMNWVESAHERLALLNSDGHDTELLHLARPFESGEKPQ